MSTIDILWLIAAGMLLLHFVIGVVLAWIGLRRREA